MGLTDSAWAARAGLRKETLSRMRRRETCDFATLHALATAAGSRLNFENVPTTQVTPDGHFPTEVNRELEQRLLELSALGDLDPACWTSMGPRFFMAGVAVMLAGAPGRDRSSLLALAERLHPGVSEPQVFARWLARSPLRPTRFLAGVQARSRHARLRHAA